MKYSTVVCPTFRRFRVSAFVTHAERARSEAASRVYTGHHRGTPHPAPPKRQLLQNPSTSYAVRPPPMRRNTKCAFVCGPMPSPSKPPPANPQQTQWIVQHPRAVDGGLLPAALLHPPAIQYGLRRVVSYCGRPLLGADAYLRPLRLMTPHGKLHISPVGHVCQSDASGPGSQCCHNAQEVVAGCAPHCKDARRSQSWVQACRAGREAMLQGR